tara:strand:- start:29 stop:289 length:261 start_codon:yes stop_codon:yes gene_type:complete
LAGGVFEAASRRPGPTAVGFDTYFGVDIPNWPPYCFIENERTVGIPSEFANLELFADRLASLQGAWRSVPSNAGRIATHRAPRLID